MLGESHQVVSEIPLLQRALDRHKLQPKNPSNHFSGSGIGIPIFLFFPMEYFGANLDSFLSHKIHTNGRTLSIISTLESDYECRFLSTPSGVLRHLHMSLDSSYIPPTTCLHLPHCLTPFSLRMALEVTLSNPIPLDHKLMQALQNRIFWHSECRIQPFLQTPVLVCSDLCFDFHSIRFLPALLPLLLALV